MKLSEARKLEKKLEAAQYAAGRLRAPETVKHGIAATLRHLRSEMHLEHCENCYHLLRDQRSHALNCREAQS